MTDYEHERFEIAGRLDENPRLCWADLASWAVGGGHPENINAHLPYFAVKPICFRGRCEGCYCGKHETNEILEVA